MRRINLKKKTGEMCKTNKNKPFYAGRAFQPQKQKHLWRFQIIYESSAYLFIYFYPNEP